MSQTTTRQEQEKLIPTPQVLSAWAIELGRLASSVEQEIATYAYVNAEGKPVARAGAGIGE